MSKKDKQEKSYIKLTFNHDDPFDAELIKALKSRSNMSSFIKYVLYRYISVAEKEEALHNPDKAARIQPSIQKERTVPQDKEKPVHQWDKDASFADAFEPLK